MRVLIVSWYFPPCSTMGALRVGKFAKYLVGEGHDVRVVCAKDQPYAMDHPVEVPLDIVYYTRWRDINWLPAKIQDVRVWLRRVLSSGSASSGSAATERAPAAPEASAAAPGLLRRMLNFYRHLTNIPDGIIGWLLPALAAGRRATQDWTPDVVFASAPPFTTLIAGRRIAKRAGAPLVIEYRDRWIEDPYGQQDPKMRQWIDRRIEEWCARPAKAVVTVSDPWADDYRERWGKPVTVCYNGYDPDDIPPADDVSANADGRIHILYTGIIYPDRRDPTPLLAALNLLGDLRDRVAVRFYGSNVDILRPAIVDMGLEETVTLEGSVPFRESLRLQQEADLLLLLQWNDVLEAGNVPGKLFEYLAARRPVLGIGYEDGVPARLLRERDAGRVLNDPAAIAAYLKELIARKDQNGAIARFPQSVCAGLSRPEQYANIEALFTDIGANRAAG